MALADFVSSAAWLEVLSSMRADFALFVIAILVSIFVSKSAKNTQKSSDNLKKKIQSLGDAGEISKVTSAATAAATSPAGSRSVTFPDDVDSARPIWADYVQQVHDGGRASPMALRGFLDVLLRAELPEEALQVCRDCLACPSLRPMVGSRVFTMLLKGFRKQGLCSEDLFKEFRDANVEADITTFNTMLATLVWNSKMQKALELLQDMANVEPKIAPDACTYCVLIKGFCRADEISRALVLVQDMRQGKLPLDETTLIALLRACCRSGRLDQGLELLAAQSGELPRPARSAAAQLLALGGRVGEALDLLEAWQLPQLLEACFQAQQPLLALELLPRMAEMDVVTQQAMDALCTGCLRASHGEKAREVLLCAFQRSSELAELPRAVGLGQGAIKELAWGTHGDIRKRVQKDLQALGIEVIRGKSARCAADLHLEVSSFGPLQQPAKPEPVQLKKGRWATRA